VLELVQAAGQLRDAGEPSLIAGIVADVAQRHGADPRKKAVQAVPVIVFHGDRDHTVQQSNAEPIVQQALQVHGAEAGDAALRASTNAGVASGGRRFTRAVHADADGQVRVESWTLHGAGHAWAGGHASGSSTDPAGPDVSAELLRFFLARPRAGSA
jgi:poly(3-hydroxybutyrate) depolymerase